MVSVLAINELQQVLLNDVTQYIRIVKLTLVSEAYVRRVHKLKSQWHARQRRLTTRCWYSRSNMHCCQVECLPSHVLGNHTPIPRASAGVYSIFSSAAAQPAQLATTHTSWPPKGRSLCEAHQVFLRCIESAEHQQTRTFGYLNSHFPHASERFAAIAIGLYKMPFGCSTSGASGGGAPARHYQIMLKHAYILQFALKSTMV
jgi:hypothetical protein